ncbi:SRPBCC family protein [Micromonospora foliorum]|uniref:SRPBCC family protein n=1 Tax=Micromonospora foliorum TaxID=2911210 RepID=UPI001EE99C76|nr:SRPBCC family protein [Micromonospora foliorum]MCG5436850.1 SRPBCC family protein [Micromonospora foliorum]
MSFSRTVSAPPEQVWQLLTDISGYPALFTKVEATELLTHHPFGQGTGWRETRSPYGEPITLDLCVTDCQPQVRYLVECHAGGHSVTEYRLVPRDGGRATTLQITYSLTGGPLSYRLGRILARQRILACIRENNTQDLLDIDRASTTSTSASGGKELRDVV